MPPLTAEQKKTLRVVILVTSIATLCVLTLVGIAFYAFNNSDAVFTAKRAIERNEKVLEEVGDVEGFGWIVTGNISLSNDVGEANLWLKAKGEKKSQWVHAQLRRQDRRWHVDRIGFD